MKKLTAQEVKKIRIELAINICIRFPSLYNKIYGKSRAPITDYESGVAEVLARLCQLEPCVGHILNFYYKRNLR